MPKKMVNSPVPFYLDKCKAAAAVDMGKTLLFAESMPGLNDNKELPFGWSEYESAFRPQFVIDTKRPNIPCRHPCMIRGGRARVPKQYFDPCCSVPRGTICDLENKVLKGMPITPDWKECREKLIIYDPDLVRSLPIHGELKREHPFVLHKNHLALIKKSITAAEEEKARCQQEKFKLAEEKEKNNYMIAEMKGLDKIKFNASISPSNYNAENAEIVTRAKTIITNEEPELRKIDQVILAAKVQAIREAQLSEKVLIEQEKAEEEKRIIALLQEQNFLDKEEDEELEDKRKKEYKDAICRQLQEKAAIKFYERERTEAGNEALRRRWEEEEMKDMKIKEEARLKKNMLGCEFMKDQIEKVEFMRDLKEYERHEDLRMIAYNKKRDAEMDALEQEKLREKKRKDAEMQKIINTRVEQIDMRTMLDDMKLRRDIDLKERQWRQREADEMRKKNMAREELKNDLWCQIQENREIIVESAAHDRALFERNNQILLDKWNEMIKDDDEKHLNNAQYKLDLREQLHRNTLTRIESRKDHYVEGIKMRKEIARREREIKDAIDQKIQSLQDANLPCRYLKYVCKAAEEELKPGWQKSFSVKK